MKILFLYLNDLNDDSFNSKKYVKEHTAFLKYLKPHHLIKLDIENSDFGIVPIRFNQYVTSHDLNYDLIKNTISDVDRCIILFNGNIDMYSTFLTRLSNDIKTVSIAITGDKHPTENCMKYDLTKNITFLYAYDFIFNKRVKIDKTLNSTTSINEIPNSLIYQMETFSVIELCYCLLYQTIPLIKSTTYKNDVFSMYPTIGRVLSDNVYKKYSKKIEQTTIDNYQNILREIYCSSDWNKMISELTYKIEANKLIS